MQAAVSSAVADDLMAIKAHLMTRPNHVPGNLIAAVGLWNFLLILPVQKNVLHWECVDPPWELPDYVGDLARALQETGAWIASGSVIEQVVVAPPPTPPPLVAPSD